MAVRGDDSTAGRAVLAGLVALIALEVYGFLTVRPWTQIVWYPIGIERFGFYAGLFVGIATPVLILAPWALAPLAVILAAAGTIHAVGWAAALAPLLFLASAWSLGSLLLRGKEESIEARLLSTLLGIGVYVWLMTLASRLHIHYAAAWLVLLLVPLLWSGLSACRAVIRAGARRSPPRLTFPGHLCLALLFFILFMHWLVVLKPEAGADGLAAHLAVASNIAAHHAYTVDPARLVWAVMPMGADWSYSIVYLLGGEFAARLLNFAYLLLMAALLYVVMRRWLSRAPALLLLAVFAATPLVQLVTGELFVENLQALLLLSVVVALTGTSLPPAKSLCLAAALAGTALATKIGSLAFVTAAIPVALWGRPPAYKSGRAGRGPAPRWALAGSLLLATAAPTYLVAWRLTGNPLYPYFNQVFHSPLLPATADVHEYRFHEPLGWSTLYDLTFHTHRYYEGQDGSFGFQFLVLAPLALLIALAGRRARAFLAVGLAGMLLVLVSTPNARYLYAALPLLMAASAAALGWMEEKQRWAWRTALGFLVVCALGNIYFLPSSSWYHKNFYLPRPLSLRWQGFHTSMVSAVRDVAIHFRQSHPYQNVLLTGDNSQADLAADAHELGWHEPVLYDAIHRALDMPAMARLMQQWRIPYVIARVPRNGDWLRPAALRELLTRCGQSEYEFEGYYLARLDPQCLDHPTAERPPVTVRPGSYDDFDGAFRYRGDWDHRDDFEGPSLHSISYTDVGGAEAALAFEGRALTYVFTKGPNRGIAEIWIDGARRADIDAYSPRIEWQSRFRICCLAPGRHEAAIRVSGRQQPASRGRFVDVDALVVE
jgi:hypothetical protein